MEDIFSIVFIAGMIIVGFIKSTKDAKDEQAECNQTPRHKNPLPENWDGEAIEMSETSPETFAESPESTPPPIPETSYRPTPRTSYPPIPEVPYRTTPDTSHHTTSMPSRQKNVTTPPPFSSSFEFEEGRGFTSHVTGKAFDKRVDRTSGTIRNDNNISPTWQQPETDSGIDFELSSTEEARKAIVWAEILKRKYI